VRGIGRRLVLGATLTGFAVGWFIQTASAGHYHVCCAPAGTGHALVHGGSTTDNVWHGRSEAGQVLGAHYCAAGSDGYGLKGSSTVDGNITCEVQVSGDPFIANDTECHSWGYVSWGTVTPAHYHYHHDVCGTAAAYP
jgi:hypothetical protein